jgi:ubiquinone/menaquinone biosynthesis C-methylase UbiE
LTGADSQSVANGLRPPAIARWYDWFTDYQARQHERAVNLANIASRAKVLDVACGTGRTDGWPLLTSTA